MGCFFLLIVGMITWFATFILVGLLGLLFDFTFNVSIVTGVWLILIVLKSLF